MKTLVVLSVLVAASTAKPSIGYDLPPPDRSSFSGGSSFNGGFSGASSGQGNIFSGQGTNVFGVSSSQGTNHFGTASVGSSFGSPFNPGTSNFGSSVGASSCGNGQVRHVDGRCVTPVVTRNYYKFNVPSQPPNRRLTPIPPPRVEHNVLFVRLPEDEGREGPIVIPPPRQNNIVYLLKKQSADDQRPIEIPQQERTNPEVYYVNYQPGENPTLPSGIDLQTALSNAVPANGQVIEGSSQPSRGSEFSTGGFGGSSSFSQGSSTGGFEGSGTGFSFGGNNFSQSGQSTGGFSSFNTGISTPSNTYSVP